MATYTDYYGCPWCAKSAETIEPWLRKEPTVRFAVMDFIVHSDTALAPVAALCMGEPNARPMSIETSNYRGPSIGRLPRSADRFWAMRSAIYRETGPLDLQHLKAAAGNSVMSVMHIDLQAIAACIEGRTDEARNYRERVDESNKEARRSE